MVYHPLWRPYNGVSSTVDAFYGVSSTVETLCSVSFTMEALWCTIYCDGSANAEMNKTDTVRDVEGKEMTQAWWVHEDQPA